MSDDLTRLVAEVAQQERELRFATFSNDDAWELGTLLVELAMERDLAVTVDIRRGRQQLFHAARPGTSPDNDSWIERKARVVERFGTRRTCRPAAPGGRDDLRGQAAVVGAALRRARRGVPGARRGGRDRRGGDRLRAGAGDDHALVVEAVRRFLDG